MHVLCSSPSSCNTWRKLSIRNFALIPSKSSEIRESFCDRCLKSSSIMQSLIRIFRQKIEAASGSRAIRRRSGQSHDAMPALKRSDILGKQENMLNYDIP